MATAGKDASIPVRTRNNMTNHNFAGMANQGGPSIDPNDLAVSGNYSNSFQHSYSSSHNNQSNMFSSGSALVGDDELLDSLGSPADTSGMHGNGQDFGSGMGDVNMGYGHGMYNSNGIQMDQGNMNGFSHTPDGDPIHSPYIHSLGQQYRPTHNPAFSTSIQSPISYAGSPLASADMHDGDNYINAKAQQRARIAAQAMARKPSNNGQSPLTPKTATMGFPVGSQSSGFGAQPIRTNGPHHEKAPSGQWMQTPNSLSSFPGSGFSSPLQQGLHNAQINDVLLKAGTSMPAKLGGPGVSSQEAKRKRRRESHNLVERRRRDNINERIQDLSKLVPAHRLDDDKIRKLIATHGQLSPSLTAVGATPAQATSSLAGPGARRAASGTAGNITTGLPIEEKDKGPNKGDILNGAVSWMRDLMWMLHMKIQQQEELMSTITDLGGQVPIELTDDERRMQTELIEAMAVNDVVGSGASAFSYTRTNGTGLRVPHHTDYKGEPIDGASGVAGEAIAISPDAEVNGVAGGVGDEFVEAGDYAAYDDDDGSGDMNFKEEDEFMDLGQ
jgi:hypothetical protein